MNPGVQVETYQGRKIKKNNSTETSIIRQEEILL
jgi:hypothetical protein